MIVEILGPPGAGKTTAVTHLDDVLQQSDRQVLSSAGYQTLDEQFGEKAIMREPAKARLRILAGLMRRQPGLVFTVLALAIMHGRPVRRRWRKSQRLLAHVIFTEQLQLRYPDRIVIHHDGFTQFLWSMLIDSKKLRGHSMIRRILNTYYSDIRPKLIVLEISDTEASSRVFARKSRGRFNRDSGHDRRTEFPRWLQYYRELMALLPNRLDIVHIDAAPPPESIADHIRELLSDPSGVQEA